MQLSARGLAFARFASPFPMLLANIRSGSPDRQLGRHERFPVQRPFKVKEALANSAAPGVHAERRYHQGHWGILRVPSCELGLTLQSDAERRNQILPWLIPTGNQIRCVNEAAWGAQQTDDRQPIGAGQRRRLVHFRRHCRNGRATMATARRVQTLLGIVGAERFRHATSAVAGKNDADRQLAALATRRSKLRPKKNYVVSATLNRSADPEKFRASSVRLFGIPVLQHRREGRA